MTDLKITRRRFIKTLAWASSAAAVDWTGIAALASAIENKSDFPVVVIGSGLGGLVSAAYLSQYGFKVTVLEQHSISGGYATSFARGGFTFDVSLHATVAEHAMPQMILEDLGLWQKLDVAYTPELRRIVTPEFDVTLPAKDPEGVKESLSKVFPHEKKGIHSFYAQMEQVIGELWGNKRYKTSMMARLEHLSLEQWMDLHVKDPGAKTCMSIFSGYYGLPPQKINALFYAIATGEYLVHGGQYYKTRSQYLSDTLAKGIENASGHLIYNTRAEKIHLNDDQSVSGVLDHTGVFHPARAVVANCPVPSLINKMLPGQALPKAWLEQVQERQPSLSSFVVWLGLNKEISAVKDYEIDLLGSAGHNDLYSSDDFAESDIGITLYDNLFKGYSEPGTSTMSIISLCDYGLWKKYETDYFNDEKQAYNREKERIAKRFIRRVEKSLLPGLSDMIEVMEIGTPLTNVFYTGNTGGAIYGYDRDMPPMKSRTPLKGLYLAGAWSHGGGYTPVMMGGRETARQVLKDF